MISWIIILIGLWVSWSYTDLGSQSALHSMVCPILAFVFLVSLIIKLVVLIGPDSGRGGHGDSGGGFWGGSGGGGGDCGGDGGSC